MDGPQVGRKTIEFSAFVKAIQESAPAPTACSGLLHQGCFRLQEISFEEVKAIIEMHGSREVVRCFSNAEIEQLLYKHLDVAIRNFNYAPVENMAVDQDAIAFRLYVTPSETQPSIRTEYGNEATKVQNLYVYCQFLTRFDPDAGPSAQ